MQAIPDYKYFGIYAFLILIIGLIFVIYRWPAGLRMTFSQHVARQRQSIVYYAVLFSIVLPLLLLFFIGWFMPIFHLSIWFSVFVALSSVCQLAATIIPETSGWKVTFHRFISGLSGILLIPTLSLVLTADAVSIPGKVTVLTGIIVMVSIIGTLMVTKKKMFTPSFVHQSIYYAGFFVPILVISYL
jgi:hypothetical protein